MKYGVLHRDLEMLALAGSQPADICAEYGHRHQHAGPGIADRRARFARRPVFLAGDRHQPAARLRDHVEREVFFVRAAGAEAFDLAKDDCGIDRLDHLISQTELLDRAGGEILDHHVGGFSQLLDEFQASRVLKVNRHGTLVGVILQEIERIVGSVSAG